ncbi:hypothetical protein TCAP_01680 [Tolypocladium capitatum]|uniref:Uncharacterized protein n=1 Tax=Tolypocladium capitatum TaxID=45235 RepID=A0A2K3QLI1_9HYPO|nr:hypothetical protein TCAP_01680 [Tolypocladium capitatum]
MMIFDDSESILSTVTRLLLVCVACIQRSCTSHVPFQDLWAIGKSSRIHSPFCFSDSDSVLKMQNTCRYFQSVRRSCKFPSAQQCFVQSQSVDIRSKMGIGVITRATAPRLALGPSLPALHLHRRTRQLRRRGSSAAQPTRRWLGFCHHGRPHRTSRSDHWPPPRAGTFLARIPQGLGDLPTTRETRQDSWLPTLRHQSMAAASSGLFPSA